MKKIVLMFVLLVGLVVYGRAGSLSVAVGNQQAWILGISDLKIATFYEFKKEDLFIGGMVDVITWKNLFSVDFGIITSITEKRIFTFGLGVNLYTLCQKLDLDWGLTNPLTVGYFYGKDLSNKDNYSGIFFGCEIKF